ncbi:MAG: 30S ribosomal protein S17 [bacterium]|nr:30S ribosomal protein S17 [bacterium]
MSERARRKTVVGKVVANKTQKTISVAVVRRYRHPLYGKTLKRTSKFMAHDEKNECQVGDTVRIMETRPLSRLKRWRLVEVVERVK